MSSTNKKEVKENGRLTTVAAQTSITFDIIKVFRTLHVEALLYFIIITWQLGQLTTERSHPLIRKSLPISTNDHIHPASSSEPSRYVTKLKPQAELEIGPSTLHELRTLSNKHLCLQYLFCINEG